MIEAAMFLALGFFSATLIGLMALPALSRRADKLARRRAEAAFPLSLDQVAADRDHLRAELALRERAFERRVEDASAERASALDVSGRKDVTIATLGREIDAHTHEIATLKDALSVMTADRDTTATKLDIEEKAHLATQGERTSAHAEIARLTAILHERNEEIGALGRQRSELQQELAGARAEISALAQQITGLQANIAELETSRNNFSAALADEQGKLAHSAGEIRMLGKDIATAHAEKLARDKTIEGLATSIKVLEASQDRLNATLVTIQGKLTKANEEKKGFERDIAKLRAEKASLDIHAEGLVSRINILTTKGEELKAALASEKNNVLSALEDRKTLDQAFMARGQELDGERRVAATHMDERDMARSEISDARRRHDELDRALQDSERRLKRVQAELQRDQASFSEKLRRAEEKAESALAAQKNSNQAFLQLREERSRLKQEVSLLKRDASNTQAVIHTENAALRREIMSVADTMLKQWQEKSEVPASSSASTRPTPAMVGKNGMGAATAAKPKPSASS